MNFFDGIDGQFDRQMSSYNIEEDKEYLLISQQLQLFLITVFSRLRLQKESMLQ